MPVTTPVADPTVTWLLLQLHIPLVIVSVSVIVELTHTDVAPDITPPTGNGLMVTTIVVGV